MGAYVEDIRELERQSRALYQALHAAVRLRGQSPLKYEDWKNAAARFADYRPAIGSLVEGCYRVSPQNAPPYLREFMFDYMIVDPQFFRSGYVMERILRRVKPLHLSSHEKRIIQDLLLNRIRTKALRNFRDICRLIPMLQDVSLRAEVESLARSSDPGPRHRAEFALAYFPR